MLYFERNGVVLVLHLIGSTAEAALSERAQWSVLRGALSGVFA